MDRFFTSGLKPWFLALVGFAGLVTACGDEVGSWTATDDQISAIVSVREFVVEDFGHECFYVGEVALELGVDLIRPTLFFPENLFENDALAVEEMGPSGWVRDDKTLLLVQSSIEDVVATIDNWRDGTGAEAAARSADASITHVELVRPDGSIEHWQRVPALCA